jgi:hypothetical protein
MTIRATSRLCGILFLTTIAAFLVGNMVLKGPLQDTVDYSNTFKLVESKILQYSVGNFIAFVGITAQFALAITLFQLLNPVNSFFARLALGWRIGEQLLLLVGILSGFAILAISRHSTDIPGAGTGLDHLGLILISISSRAEAMAFVLLGIASIFNNILFHRGRLIPSPLAILGVVGAFLYTLGAALPLVISLPPVFTVLQVPLLLFELILGIYLVARGVKENGVKV